MAYPLSHVQALLPDSFCLQLDSVEEQRNGRILITAAACTSAGYCPECRQASDSLHSRYSRLLRDLPWQGSRVDLRLNVRRFRCRARDCPRETFAELLPSVCRRYGRQTNRLCETIRLIGYVLGGEAGARLSERLGMMISPDTILRKLQLGPCQPISGAKAVGVDDWAWTKGQRYGTILVDLETHAPIDLLPDRSADSLAAWLQAHPGTKVISRDRASLYADGATRGAPQAIQVADRFHLICNLTSAVERVLEQKRSALAQAISPIINESSHLQTDTRPAAKTSSEQTREARRQRRVERYNEVLALYQKGMSQLEISRTLQVERKTIRRFLRAGAFPERAKPHRKPSSVQAFQEYLTRRWTEGCHNATQLWREVQGQGYAGGRGMIARFVSTLRTNGTKFFRKTMHPRQPKAKALSPKQAAMLLARRPEKLKSDEQQLLARLQQCCPEIPILYGLTQSFAEVFREKNEDALQNWLKDARRTGLPEMARFCDGLFRDAAAVSAAVTLPWSNGQVEGQINRLKLIKRQMYGRANFHLLRCRILPYVSVSANRSPIRSP
jgi:transposase